MTIHSRLSSLYVLLIILLSGAVIDNNNIDNLRIIVLLLSIFVIFLNHQHTFKTNRLIIPMLFPTIFLLHSILWLDTELYLKYAIFSFLISFSALYIPFSIFSRQFSNIIYVLSAFSLVFFLVILSYPDFKNYFPTSTSGTRDFYNLFIYAVYKHVDPTIISIRNSSVFVEPGMFACMIVLALLFDRANNFHLPLHKRVVLYIAGLTTFSSVMFLFIILNLFVLKFKKMKRGRLYFINLIIFLLSLLCIFYLYPKFSLQHTSTFHRFESFLIDFSIFFSSPFFGVGHFEYYSLIPTLNLDIEFSGSVSPLVNLFSIFGISLGIPILIALFNLVRSFSTSFKSRIFYLLNLIIILISQPLVLSALFFFLYNIRSEDFDDAKS